MGPQPAVIDHRVARKIEAVHVLGGERQNTVKLYTVTHVGQMAIDKQQRTVFTYSNRSSNYRHVSRLATVREYDVYYMYVLPSRLQSYAELCRSIHVENAKWMMN